MCPWATRRSFLSRRVSCQGSSNITWAPGRGGRGRFLCSGCHAKLNQRPFPYKAFSLFPLSESVAPFSATSVSFRKSRGAAVFVSPPTGIHGVAAGCLAWGSVWGSGGIAEADPTPQGALSRRLCHAARGHVCPSRRLNPSPNTRLLSGSTPKGLFSSCEPAEF